MNPKPLKQSDYWDTVLDPQNLVPECSCRGLSSESLVKFDLSTEIEFYLTPAQEYAHQQLGNIKGKKILEIGCGMGVHSILLAQKGARVTAIDISEKRLHWVNKLLKTHNIHSVELLKENGEELSFQSNSFDIVYTNAVLIHMDKIKTIKEAYRVLKPGGVAIFVEPLKYHPLVNLYRYTLGPKIWRKIASYFSFEDINQIGKLFDSYEHREFYLFSFISFYWEFGNRNLRKFKKSLSRWIPLDNFIVKICPPLKNLCWFTVFCGYKK